MANNRILINSLQDDKFSNNSDQYEFVCVYDSYIKLIDRNHSTLFRSW